jgi:hypothetical protein
MAIGDSVKLVAEVRLADGTYNGNVAWSSADDTIATINPTTGTVVAMREGRVSIVAAYAPEPSARGMATITIGDALPPVEPTAPQALAAGVSATAPSAPTVETNPGVLAPTAPTASGFVSLNLKSKVYHRASCRYFDCSNCSVVSLSEAQVRGRPCQICY